jgi:hypothetical protein
MCRRVFHCGSMVIDKKQGRGGGRDNTMCNMCIHVCLDTCVCAAGLERRRYVSTSATPSTCLRHAPTTTGRSTGAEQLRACIRWIFADGIRTRRGSGNDTVCTLLMTHNVELVTMTL